MTPFQVVPSTTSHKREPLVPTLEIFARLGFLDLDLNLHHIIEEGLAVEAVQQALAAGGQRVVIASGGWCDFYHQQPSIEATFQSIARQVAIARRLDVLRLRLFFGRLSRAAYSPDALRTIAGNLRRLSDAYPDVSFAFENHDGASLDPAVCREILETVDRANIRMNFDPINFEHAGVNSMDALRAVQPFIAHVHLKGLAGSRLCEFGTGDLDLTPLLRTLLAGGYCGTFTVEYEGDFDRTLRLYEGMRHARACLHRLAGPI